MTTGSRGHGGLWPRTPHPSKEKQSLSLKELHKTLGLMTAWFFPGFFFFNDTATTEIYTKMVVGSVRCV